MKQIPNAAWLVFIASFLGLCWFAMMAVHELGHMIGAWLAGGTVSQVVLDPLTISRTDLSRNPHPLFVAWAGPVGGAAGPLLAWGVWRAWGLPGAHLLRFFAGFCLIANGAYLGFGSFGAVGDAGDIVRHGGAPWLLWLFGVSHACGGLALWHRLGPQFGVGGGRKKVSAAAACTSLALLIAVAALEFWLSPR
jgi:hypothetical protein